MSTIVPNDLGKEKKKKKPHSWAYKIILIIIKKEYFKTEETLRSSQWIFIGELPWQRPGSGEREPDVRVKKSKTLSGSGA